MTWPWRLLISDSVICMSKVPLLRQHVVHLVMQLQRWSLVRDITVLEQIYGAVVLFSTRWYAVTCHLRTPRHLISTRKLWELNILCQSSFQASAKTLLEGFWTLTQSIVLVLMISEIILGHSRLRIETEIWAISQVRKKCLSRISFTKR